MMDEMIRIAEQLRFGLYQRLSNTGIRPLVQGAVLDVDRYWYYWWLTQSLPWPATPRPIRTLIRMESMNRLMTGMLQKIPARPPDWNYHCKSMGYQEGASPFIVLVILRNLPESAHSDLPRQYEGHPIRYEVRPPAVATGLIRELSDAFGRRIAKPMSVGRAEPNTAGTLGGFLYCAATGRTLFVGCAHVLGPANSLVYAPGPYEHRRSLRLGTVRFSVIPPLKGPGQECKFMAMPQAGRLDVAVAEYIPDKDAATQIEPQPSANRLRTAARMSPYQPVEFIGKESGRVNAQLGGVTLWHEIQTEDFGDGYPKGFRCFGVLFEMTDLRGDRNDVAQDGDSGAWVFDDLEGLRSWNGMVIARQGKRAYGCYAEFILNALDQSGQFPNGAAISW